MREKNAGQCGGGTRARGTKRARDEAEGGTERARHAGQYGGGSRPTNRGAHAKRPPLSRERPAPEQPPQDERDTRQRSHADDWSHTQPAAHTASHPPHTPAARTALLTHKAPHTRPVTHDESLRRRRVRSIKARPCPHRSLPPTTLSESNSAHTRCSLHLGWRGGYRDEGRDVCGETSALTQKQHRLGGEREGCGSSNRLVEMGEGVPIDF